MDDGMNTQTYEQNFWLLWLRLHSGTFIFSCQLFGYKHLVFVWLFNSPSVLWFHGVSVPPAMIWLLATINLRSLSLQTKARSKNNWAGPVEQQSSSNWIIMIQNDTTPPGFEAFQSLPFECHSCTSDTDPTDPIRYRCLGLSKLILVSKWESFEVPWREWGKLRTSSVSHHGTNQAQKDRDRRYVFGWTKRNGRWEDLEKLERLGIWNTWVQV